MTHVTEHIKEIKFMVSQFWANLDWLSQKSELITFTLRHKTYCLTHY